MANVTSHYVSPLGLPNGVEIPAGRTVRVDDWHIIRDHHVVKAWLAAEAISVEGDDGKQVDDAKSPAEVLAMATDGTPFMTFKSAAAKLLGDATPDKKADIVSALEELATDPGA